MNKITLSLLILLGGAATGYYFWQQGQPATSASSPVGALPSAPETAPAMVPGAAPTNSSETAPGTDTTAPMAAQPITPAPGVADHYPIPAVAGTPALPALSDSDPALWDALIGLLGRMPVQQLFRQQEIVRHIVVTVDNLPRQTTATRLLPVKPVGGALRTEEIDGKRVIASDNATRYAPYVRLADTIDAATFVKLYVRHYPLFQRAYQDLGYPDAYFNDRLIAVIDHMLAAPGSTAALALSQPHVLYEFADTRQQARSAGQKIMLRIGNANADRVKSKLRDIRAALIEQVPKQPS
jgi:hypothetical protein